MIEEKPRVVVISHYKALPTSVSVWLREGWDELTEEQKATKELVCEGTFHECHAIADVIESNLNLNREGVTQ